MSTKTCITLRRLPLALPTSGPIPRVLGCGLTSHFGDSKIPILFKKVTHNILVYGKVKIIDAVTSVLFISNEVEYED